jgi:hypothetical protein
MRQSNNNMRLPNQYMVTPLKSSLHGMVTDYAGSQKLAEDKRSMFARSASTPVLLAPDKRPPLRKRPSLETSTDNTVKRAISFDTHFDVGCVSNAERPARRGLRRSLTKDTRKYCPSKPSPERTPTSNKIESSSSHSRCSRRSSDMDRSGHSSKSRGSHERKKKRPSKKQANTDETQSSKTTGMCSTKYVDRSLEQDEATLIARALDELGMWDPDPRDSVPISIDCQPKKLRAACNPKMGL